MFALFANEIPLLAEFFENTTLAQQTALLKNKGLKKFSRRQHDSILIAIDDRRSFKKTPSIKPLLGYRVAIDPGHFSTGLKEAQTEQKYLYFVKDSIANPHDSIKLFESALTFNTASQLKVMLEAQGANVLVTRDQDNHTSFNCTYEAWIQRHKKRMLDSLQSNQLITSIRYKQLLKLKDYNFFWEFFRDFDLANRAKKINAYAPHVSVVIHFNVDELNNPWKKFSEKNFTMAFIGGAMTADNISKTEGRLNFLRLLLTPQLEQSERLAARTVKNFHKELKVPIAGPNDALYLRDNCLATKSAGVFSRNLILCRKINSPLVYGESLYQDNVSEAAELMKSDLDVYGIKSNARLRLVAQSYSDAVMDFLLEKP